MTNINLVVGSLITFQTRTADRALYSGTVYFFDPTDGRFGIENVTQHILGRFEIVEGNYQFTLDGIEDLHVLYLRRPPPDVTTSTKKDDDKSNPGGGASSSAPTAASNC